MNRQENELLQSLAFQGALERAWQLVKIFPQLLPELQRLAKERSPKRRLTADLRAELQDAVDVAASNGHEPTKKRKKFSAKHRRAISKRMKGRKWTAEQRAKFLATMKSKTRKREAAHGS